MSFNKDISMVSAEPFQVFTRNADISPKYWRRLMLRAMSCRQGNLTTRFKPSFRVCSPDIAIPATSFTASPRYSISKSFTNYQTTRGRKRNYSRRSYRWRQYRSRLLSYNQINRIIERAITSPICVLSILDLPLSSSSDAGEHTKQVSWKSRESLGDGGSTTTPSDYSISGNI